MNERAFLEIKHRTLALHTQALKGSQAAISQALEVYQPLFNAWVSTPKGKLLVPKVGVRVGLRSLEQTQLYALPGGLYRMGVERQSLPLVEGTKIAASWDSKSPAPNIDYFTYTEAALDSIRRVSIRQREGGLASYDPSPLPE